MPQRIAAEATESSDPSGANSVTPLANSNSNFAPISGASTGSRTSTVRLGEQPRALQSIAIRAAIVQLYGAKPKRTNQPHRQPPPSIWDGLQQGKELFVFQRDGLPCVVELRHRVGCLPPFDVDEIVRR